MAGAKGDFAAQHERNPRPSRRTWKPAADAAAASPDARRTQLLEAASRSVPLDPATAAALLGGGWSGARLARLRPGSRVAAGSARAGAFRVWPAGGGQIKLTAIDGMRAPGAPLGRPVGTVDR